MFCETTLKLGRHAAAVSESAKGGVGGGADKLAKGKNHSDQMEPQIVLKGLLPQQNHMGQKCYLAKSHLCLSRHGEQHWRIL